MSRAASAAGHINSSSPKHCPCGLQTPAQEGSGKLWDAVGKSLTYCYIKHHPWTVTVCEISKVFHNRGKKYFLFFPFSFKVISTLSSEWCTFYLSQYLFSVLLPPLWAHKSFLKTKSVEFGKEANTGCCQNLGLHKSGSFCCLKLSRAMWG